MKNRLFIVLYSQIGYSQGLKVPWANKNLVKNNNAYIDPIYEDIVILKNGTEIHGVIKYTMCSCYSILDIVRSAR